VKHSIATAIVLLDARLAVQTTAIQQQESRQLALHCHLRSPIPSVVLGFNHKADSTDPRRTSLSDFNTIGQCTAELLMI